MGCDIHMFIEKRLRPEDPWQIDENHTYRQYASDEPRYLAKVTATGRNYLFFAKLAGVRGGGALYRRRGIPHDASEEIRAEAESADWHSHSWLSLDEFKKCLDAAGYCLSINTSTEAFFDWRTYSGRFEAMPENYTTVVNYCEQLIRDEAAEAQLLNRTDVIPEVRIIFWFDN